MDSSPVKNEVPWAMILMSAVGYVILPLHVFWHITLF